MILDISSTTSMTAFPTSHLQLCINDLLHPTEKSETLLESLTSTQLEEIEKTLHKIKEKKQFSPEQKAVPSTQAANTASLHHDWTMVAAQIAKVLADTIASSTNATKNTAKPSSNVTPAKPPITGDSPNKSTTSSPSPAVVNTTATTVPTAELTNAVTSGSVVANHEPRTEVREGVEWVSFVYSHHRVLRRYSIRTDVDQVDITILDDKFKSENCVYPRANLPRDQYRGNRWAYETECNTLGWKLAYLNATEIAGKRGLIQRAVDSYRNRYPSMRSRRVARQEKLMKGTLRKRKQRESEEPIPLPAFSSSITESDENASRPTKYARYDEDNSNNNNTQEFPKTVSIDDGLGGAKCRIRINVDSVSLDSIDLEFRKSNCVYPRAMEINTHSPFASQRQLEEARCNELGWKLAWLNPKQLGNRKNLLQRVLDVYRSKFLPELNPRKNSLRMFSDNSTHPTIDTTTAKHLSAKPTIPLTAEALAAQQQQLSTAQTISTEKVIRRGSAEKNDDDESLYSGTTDSLDFHDCFSPPAEQTDSPFISSNSSGGSQKQQQVYSSPNSPDSVMLSPSASIQDLMLGVTNDDMSFGPHQTSNNTNDSCRLSISSTSSNLTSPNLKLEAIDDDDSSMFKDTITSNSMFELYADPIQLPSVGVDFEHCGFKEESVDQLNDTLINQLFHM